MDNPSSPEAQDLIFGSGVRLRPLRSIHNQIGPCGITYRGLLAWIRGLNIPIIHIGENAYINPRYFEIAVHAITRPGNPDFLVPGSKAVTRKERHPGPHTSQLNIDYFHKHIKEFITELILARRQQGRRNHEKFTESVSVIVDRITSQYDLLDAPLAYHNNTARALKEARLFVQSSEHPSHPDEDRIPYKPSDDIIDPFQPPKDPQP